MKQTLAMCIRCRDDLDCLKENIEYHTLIGVEHFFIYDHLSVIPLKSALADYDNVTVELVLTKEKMLECYYKCWCENKNKFQWIAFIDTDEFIVMKDGNIDLKEFLQPYEKYGGLVIWWKNFGTSGHKTKQKSVIHSYTGSVEHNGPGYKTILQTQYGHPPIPPQCNPHYCVYFKSNNRHQIIQKFAVDENFIKMPTPLVIEYRQVKRNINKIQLNHYLVRSLEDLEEKIKRYRDFPRGQKLKGWRNTRTTPDSDAVVDNTIIDFLDKLEKEKGDKDD